jgi:hypothetical protein
MAPIFQHKTEVFHPFFSWRPDGPDRRNGAGGQKSCAARFKRIEINNGRG